MSQSVPGRLVQSARGVELALEWGDRVTVVLVPEAHQLGELLRQAHLPDQRRDTYVIPGGQELIGDVRIAHGLVPLGRVGTDRQPLTAPCRPLTMRRCSARKNTRAGTIANVVKANTPAVSEEYCDE